MTEVKVIPLLPPVDLIPECQEPVLHGDTYGEVVEYASAMHGAFAVCHAEIDALQEWMVKHQNGKENTHKDGAMGF